MTYFGLDFRRWLVALLFSVPASGLAAVLTQDGLSLVLGEEGQIEYLTSNFPIPDNWMGQGFYYRIGSNGGERPLGSMWLEDTKFSSVGAQYSFVDEMVGLTATLGITLLGRFDGVVAFRQSLTFNNATDSALDLHLFFRAVPDLDITLSPAHASDFDDVRWVNPTTMQTTSPRGSKLITRVDEKLGQTPDRYLITMDPRCFRFKPAGGCETWAFIDELGSAFDDLLPTTLTAMPEQSDPPGDIHPPWCDLFGSVEPGNTKCYGRQWAWQWNLVLEPQSPMSISIDNRYTSQIPLPATSSLLIAAAIAATTMAGLKRCSTGAAG